MTVSDSLSPSADCSVAEGILTETDVAEGILTESDLGSRPRFGRDAAPAPSLMLATLQELQCKVRSLGLESLNKPILTSTWDLDGLE